MSHIDEAQVEIVAVDCFRELGYEYIHGPDIAPEGDAPERADYGQAAEHGDIMLPASRSPLSGWI